jgi:recombinational DNA repair protein RecR
MLNQCQICGKYTVEQPCYQCLKKERDELRSKVDQDLHNELQRYKTLYHLAQKTCPVCKENCIIRDNEGHKAAATRKDNR